MYFTSSPGYIPAACWKESHTGLPEGLDGRDVPCVLRYLLTTRHHTMPLGTTGHDITTGHEVPNDVKEDTAGQEFRGLLGKERRHTCSGQSLAESSRLNIASMHDAYDFVQANWIPWTQRTSSFAAWRAGLVVRICGAQLESLVTCEVAGRSKLHDSCLKMFVTGLITHTRASFTCPAKFETILLHTTTTYHLTSSHVRRNLSSGAF